MELEAREARLEKPSVIESKRFYRHLEELFAGLDPAWSSERFAAAIAPRILSVLGGHLGVVGVQLYRREADRGTLLGQWGETRADLSHQLPRRPSSPDTTAIHDLPWAGVTAAGPAAFFAVDPSATLLLALHTTGDGSDAQPGVLQTSIASLDYAVHQHLRQREMLDSFEQARAIQLSLLPPGRPTFGAYDIAAVSLPAKSVGGDLYDFIELGSSTLAITVADASGHGLPAALQARDVAMGLRMGAERDFKIRRMIEKLNRIIHASGLVSRFVSLVYGELELDGGFTYVNAGHPPPLLLDARGIRELSVGGPVLGPIVGAGYQLGFERLEPGAMLVLYTDGVLERGSEEGREFGAGRLESWMREWNHGSSDRAVANLVQQLQRHSEGAPFQDDVTVVVIQVPA